MSKNVSRKLKFHLDSVDQHVLFLGEITEYLKTIDLHLHHQVPRFHGHHSAQKKTRRLRQKGRSFLKMKSQKYRKDTKRSKNIIWHSFPEQYENSFWLKANVVNGINLATQSVWTQLCAVSCVAWSRSGCTAASSLRNLQSANSRSQESRNIRNIKPFQN